MEDDTAAFPFRAYLDSRIPGQWDPWKVANMAEQGTKLYAVATDGSREAIFSVRYSD